MAPEAASHQDQQKDVGESNKTEVCVCSPVPSGLHLCPFCHWDTVYTLHMKTVEIDVPLETWDT